MEYGDRVAGVSVSPLSRRGLLRSAGAVGLAGAGALLTACDFDPPSAEGPSPPPPDPDQSVVDAARAELTGLVSRLSATSGASALVTCHLAQLAALGGAPPPVTRRSRPLTQAQAVARERRAADRFAHWATTARSGDLARVLAAVSAGIRMQPVLREP
jgi:hypothetical protein